ncbi:MAG: methyltransferase domain-containing protein, partial [Pseudomonadota bacterium]
DNSNPTSLDNIVGQQRDWLNSPYAGQYFASQLKAMSRALRQVAAPSTLVLGYLLDVEEIAKLELPIVFKVEAESGIEPGQFSVVVADLEALPFPQDCFDTVILAHALENSSSPHSILREASRVLKPEGHLVLTGFNPYSLVGLQRKLGMRAVPRGTSYPSRRIIDWLELLEFEVVGSSMHQYGPLTRSKRLKRPLRFMENVGDRWFPLLGGGYVLTAKKRQAGVTLIGKLSGAKLRPKIATAPARTSLKNR